MSLRAIDGARTRGLDLGKVARYQLRHYRICRTNSTDLIIIHDFTYFVNVIFVFFHVQNMLLSADNQSGWWESNPRIQLGRLVFYHWTTPAKCPEPESNQWHEDFQSSALPTELSGHWHIVNDKLYFTILPAMCQVYFHIPLNLIFSVVSVHSYLVPATIYAHKINCIDFGACKLVIFMHNLHENTSRHTTCVQ